MDHELYDLLLSAYLDGELSADERAQVEQLLATNAEARQLVEELKAIRAGLQSLPKHKLEPDFAQQILRRAEQQSQLPPDAPAKVSPAQAAILPQHDPWRPSVFRSTRGIAWSAIAIAAAVIIMVATRSDEHAGRQVAQQPASVRREAGGAQSAEGKVAQQAAADRREIQMQPAAAPPSMNVVNEEKPGPESGNRATETATASENNLPGSLSTSMRSSVAAARSGAGAQPMGGVPQSHSGRMDSQKQGEAPASPDVANPVVIVQVGLKAEPTAKKEFEKVLANNRIALDAEQGNTRDQTDRKQLFQEDRSAQGKELDVVYVETSPEQFTAVLSDLSKSKSLLSTSTSASAPLPVDDKDGAPQNRARRIDAVHDDALRRWVTQHVEHMSQSAERGENATTHGIPLSLIDEAPNKANSNQQNDAEAITKAPAAENFAPPGTAQLYLKNAPSENSQALDKAKPRPLVRALFVLRCADSASSANAAGSTGPAAPAAGGEESAPAPEKQ